VKAEDTEFLNNLLGEVENLGPRPNLKPSKTETKRRIRPLSPPVSENKRVKVSFAESNDSYMPDTPPVASANDDDYAPIIDDMEPVSDPHLPSSPLASAAERRAAHLKAEEDDDDDMEVAQPIGHSGVELASVNLSAARPAPKVMKQFDYPTPASSSPPRPIPSVDATSWNDVNASLNLVSSPATGHTDFNRMDHKDALEDDGSLNFFWIDYTEVNGNLCLFGKIKNKKTGKHVSCFVKVDGIMRKLFFLPRKTRRQQSRDTEEPVDIDDVTEEVDSLLSKMRISNSRMKPCTRKYAFELPGVPKEAEYLKVFYPYTSTVLPLELSGETFSHVFGTNTNIFEQFVLWKNIMGPCWLKIDNGDFQSLQNSSWCKLDVQVSKPADISVLPDSDNVEPPQLTLMSMSMRTIHNADENRQEILAISTRIYENVALGETRPTSELPCRTVTIIRPTGSQFPIGFEAEAKKHRGTIKLERQEQSMLSYFLSQLQVVDPDVLVGHQLEGVDYSILLSRLKDKKIGLWHRIGRMKRNDWPKTMGKMGGSFFAERQLVSGRLLCDLANDLGKSLMTKCQSWSLTEMVELILGAKRQELDNEAALKTWASTREGLMNYINHCETDTYYVAAIALKVQMLPLTKVLTNLAGNSWARTLSGTRAERNEYILLHEFSRQKFICPDKTWGKTTKQDDENDEEGGSKKKDKFKGGLVFEPEKGLYDKFILVMDFNSLYPSIIQEFNICFTTVERGGDDDENQVPEVPTEQTQGVLPKLISTLVSRRRQVKSLMKDKRATPEQLAQWDIKQQALKLTANSMYGCLGYVRSRFYARPLAMLTTFKGREILRSTKELAESSLLQVIYGDTDSVMINTNTVSMADAMKVGHEFKKAVNERYRLLEIDIDNVFRRLLLHAKKKYAAINVTELDGKEVDKLEVKGLDMKRREYCALSKEVSAKLLNEILSGEETEVVAERIHDYLRDLSEKMRAQTVPVPKYIIYTKLGKNPRDYPQGDSMPQVQVALRELSRGKNIRVNDVMAFIVTGDSANSSENPAKRAYTPQDVLKPDSGLLPDIDWYLSKQIFPPVERLCAPIDGTDAARIADCLGLDVRKYALASSSASGGASQEKEIFPLESQIADEIRYAHCTRLQFRCPACTNSFTFNGLTDSISQVSASGLTCPNASCQKTLPMLALVTQLESQIRARTSRYYEAWLVCDDSSCGNRTRQTSVYGHRCMGPKGHAHGCSGKMRYEMGTKEMSTQLLYWKSLFDSEKARAGAKGESKGKPNTIVSLSLRVWSYSYDWQRRERTSE
jgi:DNA polymerase alpha subunit A